MPEDTKAAPQYVALKDLRFGSLTLRKGDPVPQEKGRSYHQMLSLGQIGPAPAGATPAQPEGTHALLLQPASRVAFIDVEGGLTWVTFEGMQQPDEEARVALQLDPGQPAALVLFPDETEALLVSLASLLPEDPTVHLVSAYEQRLAEEVRKAAETAANSSQKAADELREQVSYLELLLKAVRTQGQPLPADLPGSKDLAAVGITSREGLLLLASGEQGRQNLIRLEGIGGKTATRILEALAAPPASADPPAPAATPPADPPPEG